MKVDHDDSESDQMEMEVEEEEDFEIDSYTEKNTFDLNTQSTCFLCLKQIKKLTVKSNTDDDILESAIGRQEEEESSDENEENFSLHSICRYLRFNFKDFLPTRLEKGSLKDAEKVLEKTTSFSVKLCEECRSLISNFSEMCTELALLQMKIDQCVQSVFGTLKDSEMDIPRIKKFRKTFGSVDEIHVILAEALRKEIKKKCDIRMKSVQPKVLITDYYHPPIPSPSKSGPSSSPSSSSTKRFKCTKCQMTFTHRIGLKHHEQKHKNEPLQVHIPPRYKTAVPRLQVGMRDRAERKLTKLKTKHTCTICDPPLVISADGVKKHKIKQHVDIFLYPHKAPNVNNEDFLIYCNHVFKAALVSSRTGIDAKGVPICYCPHCPNTYRSHCFLRFHLFGKHLDEMAKNLVQLQKNITVDELRDIKLPPCSFAAVKKEVCDKCGASFSYVNSLQRHQRQVCKFGPQLKPRMVIYKCQTCEKVFTDSGGFSRHKKFVHPPINEEDNEEGGGSAEVGVENAEEMEEGDDNGQEEQGQDLEVEGEEEEENGVRDDMDEVEEEDSKRSIGGGGGSDWVETVMKTEVNDDPDVGLDLD